MNISMSSGKSNRDVNHDEDGMEMEKVGISKINKSMLLPQKPISVEARHVTYQVTLPRGKQVLRSFASNDDNKIKSRKLTILHDLTFTLKPREMTLLIGGPAAGKTSILNLLAMNLPQSSYKSGRISGNLSVNGLPPNPLNWNRSVAYCTQEDVFLPLLTVKETLYFAAAFQMPEKSTPAEINERVEAVLEVLGLKHCENTIIGDGMIRGISGGEKRRVSIGIAWVKCPSVFLLDEPTTGLDNTAALSIVQSLRQAADSGCAILCCLLQPSWEIFSLFDKVMIVSRGQIAYHGPVNQVLEYFEDMGFSCPITFSKAEFVSEIVDHSSKFLDNENSVGVPAKTPEDFIAYWKQHPMYQEIEEDLEVNHPFKGPQTPHAISEFIIEEEGDQKAYPRSSLKQTKFLIHREAILFKRNFGTFLSVSIFSSLVALMIGAYFFRLDGSSIQHSQIKVSAIFFAILFPAFVVMADVPKLVEDRRIFAVQRRAKWFSSAPFFWTKVLWMIPVALSEVLFYGFIIFWMLGLNTGENTSRFWFFALGMFGISISSRTIGYGVINLLRSPTTASSGSGVLLCAFVIFCGAIVSKGALPSGWIWFYWANPVSYMLKMLLVNEFAGRRFECASDELIPSLDDSRLYLPVSEGGFEGSRVCPYRSGAEFLEKKYEIKGDLDMRWVWLGSLLGFQLLAMIIWFIALKYIRYEEHNKRSRQTANNKETQPVETQFQTSNEELPHDSHFHGALLSWKNLSYTVDGKKRLLNNISGYVKPGMMLALMGASGAGKSTLLDVLAQRKNTGKVTGEILLNGRPLDAFFKRRIGYVEQTDSLWPGATVKESITFSAKLRSDVSEEEQKRTVEWCLRVLNLDSLSNSQVDFLSAEQRKRVSIAIEIAIGPQILFLDEPTSGLDSDAADSVVTAIQNLAAAGISIICTIHQPSSRLFSRFTDLLLLKKGGELVYFGQLGNQSEKVLNYFSMKGFQCPPFTNPAAFIVDSGNGDESSNLGAFDTTDLNKFIDRASEESAPDSNNEPNSEFATSWWRQFELVSARFIVGLRRRPKELILHLSRSLLLAIIFGTAVQVRNDGQGAGSLTLLFASLIYADVTCFAMMPISFYQRTVYYREKAAGFYHSTAFSVAQLTCYMLPLQISGILFYGILLYWIAGFAATAGQFFFFLLAFTGIGLASIQIGNFLVTCFNSLDTAGVLYTLIFVMFECSAGYLVPYTRMKEHVKWTYWLSLFHYSMESLVTNEIAGKNFQCHSKDMELIQINGTSQEYCPFMNGDQLLDEIGFKKSMMWSNVAVVYGSWLFINLAIVLGMKWFNHQKR